MESLTTDSAKLFLGYGVVGAVAVIEALVIWYQNKKVDRLQADLVAAWKSLGEIVGGNNLTLASFVTSNEARTRALEANTRVQEILAERLRHDRERSDAAR